MKKWLIVLLTGFFLTACGQDVDEIKQSDDEKAKAKTENRKCYRTN